MPIYAYDCSACGHDFERLQKRHIEALRQRKSTPDAIAPRVAAATTM